MDLTLSGSKVSGTITQGGMTVGIIDGTVDGKKAIMKSQRTQNGTVVDQTWSAELKDDKTFVVSLALPNGGPRPEGTPPPATRDNASVNILPVTLHRAK